MKSNYLLIDKLRAFLDNRARIYKSSCKEVSNAVSGGKCKQSSLFRRYIRCFGHSGCNNVMMPKARTKGSEKCDGGSNRNLNANPTMLLEMRVSG